MRDEVIHGMIQHFFDDEGGWQLVVCPETAAVVKKYFRGVLTVRKDGGMYLVNAVKNKKPSSALMLEYYKADRDSLREDIFNIMEKVEALNESI